MVHVDLFLMKIEKFREVDVNSSLYSRPAFKNQVKKAKNQKKILAFH